MKNEQPDSSKEKETSLWHQISSQSLVKFLLFFATGWALITIFHYFEQLFFTFTVSAIIAFLLSYPVRYLQRFLGRGIALGLVIISTLIILITALTLLGIAANNQFQQLIGLITSSLNSNINTPLENLESFFANRNILINLEPLQEQLRDGLASSLNFVLAAVSSIPNVFLSFIIIVVISFFMLIDGEKIWKLVLKSIPESHRDKFALAVQDSFLGFFRGQILISFFLSISTFIIFVILRVPFALSLSIIVGVFDTIPGIGATLGIIIITLVAFIQGGFGIAIPVMIASIILQQIQDNFIAPRILQKAMNINPVVLFFALMVGAKIAGLWGIFVSVPVAATIINFLEIDEIQN